MAKPIRVLLYYKYLPIENAEQFAAELHNIYRHGLPANATYAGSLAYILEKMKEERAIAQTFSTKGSQGFAHYDKDTKQGALLFSIMDVAIDQTSRSVVRLTTVPEEMLYPNAGLPCGYLTYRARPSSL